jgi:hypothetical protein
MLSLHPKIKAAALAALAVVAAAVAAYASGQTTAADAFATAVAGLIPVIVGYLKGADSTPPPAA